MEVLKMYDVNKIANWFIWYNEYIRDFENEDTDDITNMKLQKLLFYAQSAFLAIKGVPLFNNNILAWEHGPVIPEIYDKFKINGNKGITEYSENDLKDISKDDVNLLIDVYNLFGEYSAWGLRNLTHSENPWKSTERNDVITIDKMANTFKEKYLEA
jgi:prophage ps3 protein 01